MKAFIHRAQGVGDRDAVTGQCSLRGAGMTATRRGLQGCTGRPDAGVSMPSPPAHHSRPPVSTSEWEMIHPSMAPRAP